MLAREWAFRGHHYFSIWYEAGGDHAYRYTADELNSYVPYLEWCEWATEQDVTSPAWNRIMEVQRALPQSSV